MGATSLTEVTRNVDRYSLIEKIGEGYLGPVYRGFDQDLGTPVVIRILYEGIRWDARVEELFNREMHAVASLQHPNISKILGFGKEEQTRYIAMESLGGGTLENLIAQNSSVPVEKKLSIMIQISEGLSHAHKNGVIHHDLVPGKIHLAPDGSAKIRDFAIAHVLMKALPRPAVRFGAPIYLCPEQIQQNQCDARSDIFSIGTIFYELITHCHPFHDRDSNKALDNIISDAPIPTFEKFPDAPPGIWTILRSCLAIDPKERYQSAEELSNACRQLLVSMAEDTQLVLSELYASLSPLRKAAAQPGAAPAIVNLMNDIQQLLRGEKEADYAYLDHLMNSLMEQYPSIQAAANEPPSLDSLCPQLPPEEPEISFSIDFETKAVEVESAQPQTPLEEPLEPAQQQDPAVFSAPVSEETLPPFEPDPKEYPAPSQEVNVPLVSSIPVEAAGEEPIQPAPPSSFPFAAEPEKQETGSTAEPPAVPPSVPLAPEPAACAPLVEESLPSEPSVQPEPPPEPIAAPKRRRIRRPSYRAAVVLLSILVIATAGYIALGTEAATSIRNAWNICLPYSASLLQNINSRYWGQPSNKAPQIAEASAKENADTPELLMKEAQTLASENRIEESKGILHKILETNPGYEPAIAELKNLDSPPKTSLNPVETATARITGLLNSGKLQLAKVEIDNLQPTSPKAAEGLRKRWQALSGAKQVQEQWRKDEEQQKLLRQKEEEWNRQLSEFLSRGKYGEASGALGLWLSEDPGSVRAQDLNARVQEIQRQLKNYASALAENRYPEAFNALNNAEKMNPSDPNLADMRRQVETRKAAARAALTIHRLGPKAALLLDGKPIGKDGELENEPIPIGNHTLAIENDAGLIASRIQEYSEGQHVVLVYDAVKQTVRSMTDADREMLAQRKAMEDVERFSLEHDHGVFRGSCRGVLSLNFLDVAYSPSSGDHGFRIPFKLLKLKADGKTITFYNIADDTHFKTFRFADAQSAYKFRQKWDELKTLLH